MRNNELTSDKSKSAITNSKTVRSITLQWISYCCNNEESISVVLVCFNELYPKIYPFYYSALFLNLSEIPS